MHAKKTIDMLHEKELLREQESEKKELNRDHIKSALSHRKYEFIRPIGAGSFGSVFLIHSQKYNQDFVVKVSDYKGKTGELDQTEINNLINLVHPNIIKMYETFIEYDYLFLVLEYCEGGSLEDVVENFGPIRAPLLFTLCSQIITALKHCHDRNIVHRDLKPANVFIDKNKRPKLADFGLSNKMDENSKLIKAFGGSKPYMAPEIFNRCAYDPFAADVWALGVTFYQISTGKLPWNSTNMKEMRLAITLGVVSFKGTNVPPIFAQLVRQMLEIKVEKRITLDKLLNHSIFQLKEQKSLGNGLSIKGTSSNVSQLNLTLFKTSNKSKDILNVGTIDEKEKDTDGEKEKPMRLANCGIVLSFQNVLQAAKMNSRGRNVHSSNLTNFANKTFL
ncbi:CAMK family protein kinase [Tritrichomonas foetus]|uniref:CAMK family protein kinase n=1 Tax=Tritrichomonas foetus TaxID=1144522 RepID=A0A1J4J2G7_9EUKA|nr:CAMK family protein kinase [Tritrichomonas foetus]|eukprot:OHS93648.1 CAMK family protein kinase [Tritrichomonas foetus]